MNSKWYELNSVIGRMPVVIWAIQQLLFGVAVEIFVHLTSKIGEMVISNQGQVNYKNPIR